MSARSLFPALTPKEKFTYGVRPLLANLGHLWSSRIYSNIKLVSKKFQLQTSSLYWVTIMETSISWDLEIWILKQMNPNSNSMKTSISNPLPVEMILWLVKVWITHICFLKRIIIHTFKNPIPLNRANKN